MSYIIEQIKLIAYPTYAITEALLAVDVISVKYVRPTDKLHLNIVKIIIINISTITIHFTCLIQAQE